MADNENTEPTEPETEPEQTPEPAGTDDPTVQDTISLTALGLVKARLNRLSADTSIDVYLQARIDAAEGYLRGIGIDLTNSQEDLLLLVDTAVWQYQNRDKPGMMPEWLRLQMRERWIRTKEAATDDS